MKKVLVSYIASLVFTMATSIALDRALVTGNAGFILLASLGAIVTLLSIMITFSEWKNK